MATSHEFPVSPNQQRYILAESLTDARYAQPSSWIIEGKLDAERLLAAIPKVVQRHEMLRVSLVSKRGRGYFNCIHTEVDVHVDRRSIAAWSPSIIEQMIEEYFYQPQTFRNTDLVRFQLIAVGEDRHVFTSSFHHAIGDAVSWSIFRKELADIYNGGSLDTTPVPYSSLLRDAESQSEARRHAQTFWRNYLADHELVTRIPPDLAPGARSFAMDLVEFALDPAIAARAMATARKLGVSPFVLYSTVYSILVGRFVGSRNVATLFQSAGRRPFPGSENTIGLFSNALVLKTRWDSESLFCDIARDTRLNLGHCLKHEVLPYHEVVSDTGISANIGINWMPDRQGFPLDGLRVWRHYFRFAESDHDLNLRIADEDRGITLYFAYNKGLFLPERIADFGGQFVALLQGACSDPERRVSNLRATAHVPPIAATSTPTRDEASDTRRIHECFLEQAAARPDSTAIEYAGRKWSYRELDSASASIRDTLAQAGVSQGAKVAIIARRNPGLIAMILATIKEGCSFAILDASHPPARLARFVEILQPSCLAICEDLELPQELFALPPGVGRIRFSGDCGIAQCESAAQGVAMPGSDSCREGTAYYLFTSGSTGEPKCLSVGHAPLIHFLQWQVARFGLDRNDRVTLLSGLGHDPCLRDIFLPLSTGGVLLIPDDAVYRDARTLFAWIADSAATACHLTPQLGRLILGGRRGKRQLEAIRYLFWGGDMLGSEQIREFAAVVPRAVSVNLFGATETPQAFGFFVIEHDRRWRIVPIGRGLPGIDLYVEDDCGARAAFGEYGQVVARSRYLANGYVNPVESVAGEARQASGFSDDGGTYRFGDYGYTLPDGNIVCTGRRDDQVKIRGFRVETGEISRCLDALDTVQRVITLAVGSDDHDRKLAAYIEPAAGCNPDRSSLRMHLETQLPRHLVPDYLVFLQQMPLLPNGKIDRKQLPNPGMDDLLLVQRQYTPPKNQMERDLIADWEEILAVSGIGADDTFLTLGGDSLSYVGVQLSLERRLGGIPHDWSTMTVRELAAADGNRRVVRMLDTSILIRAVATVLVVMGHINFFSIGKGSTGALFLVTGFLLCQFQVPQMIRQNSSSPLLSLFGKILLPVLAYTVLISSVGSVPHYSMLFMFSNWMPKGTPGVQVHMWYVHALLQILLLLALLMSFRGVRRGIQAHPYEFCVGLFLVTAAVRFASPMLLELVPAAAATIDLDRVGLLPTSNLATIALGMCMYYSDNLRQRTVTLALLLGYWALSPLVLGDSQHVLLLLGVLLLFVREVPVVEGLKQVAYVLAGASLFIYLMQFTWFTGLSYLGIEIRGGLRVLVALSGGVAAWVSWNWLRFRINALRNRRDQAAIIDAV